MCYNILEYICVVKGCLLWLLVTINFGNFLIDKNMKKMDLKEAAGIGSTTLSKLSKNQPVSMEVIMKLCGVLGCNVGDIMDVIEKQ